MASEWNSMQHFLNATHTQTEEFWELYERARRATQEAQRQGDAQLKAAVEATMFVPAGTVGSCSLVSMTNNTLLESAYYQTATLLSDKKDVLRIVFQFLIRNTLIYLIFQSGADSYTSKKMHFGLWIAAQCATLLIMPSRYSSWCQGHRGVVLLLASSVLWFGEVVAVLATYSHCILDMVHLLSQCIFSSILHRAPLCSHLKTRLFGFGLQIVGTLAMVSKVYDALPAILFFSMSHVLGVALAYVSNQQSRAGFLKSTSHFAFNTTPRVYNVRAMDPQACSWQARKRALGGFAGGFAGVSSLRCPYPPSISTVSSSSCSSNEDYVSSEVSCSSSSTVDNNLDSVLSQQRYFSCPSSSKRGLSQGSDTVCSARSGLECNGYWSTQDQQSKRQV